MKSNPLYATLLSSSVFFICLAAGCSSSSDQHRVNGKAAIGILDEVLSSWKAGQRPEDWRSRKPEVVVQDMDWKSGAKLLNFELLDEGQALDANLHCHVKIKLEMPGKKTIERTVTYIVGTSPVQTVFRSFEP